GARGWDLRRRLLPNGPALPGTAFRLRGKKLLRGIPCRAAGASLRGQVFPRHRGRAGDSARANQDQLRAQALEEVARVTSSPGFLEDASFKKDCRAEHLIAARVRRVNS